MIHARIDDDAARRYLAGVHPQVHQRLAASIGRLTLQLLREVKAGKLSGQVLNVRTGRLRRSINQRLEQRDPLQITGYVGTNVVYGRRHELGFTGSESVRQHLRTVTQAWGRPLRAPRSITVRAHSRRVSVPPRSFLRSALQDMAPAIRQTLQAAVAQGLRR